MDRPLHPDHHHPAGWRYRHRAMATEFELYLYDEARGDAEHAAEAVFAEIDRVESLLSYFRPTSNIARLNALPPGEPLRLHPDTLDCLLLAKHWRQRTHGAFDPTAGALLSGRTAWDDEAWQPDANANPRCVGLDLIEISTEHCAAARLHPDVQLDLGGIGKGFALDLAGKLLRERGIACANLVAGQSTMLMIGTPPDGKLWTMRIRDPHDETTRIDQIALGQGSISASSSADDPHVINPATGQAQTPYIASWVVTNRAADSDALATALLLLDSPTAATMTSTMPEFAARRITRDTKHEFLGRWQTLQINDAAET